MNSADGVSVQFATAALAACVSLSACADRPWVGVSEDFGAFFKDGKNEMTREGLEQYADSILAGGKVTHVFWSAVAGRASFAATATDPVWAGLEDPKTVWGIAESIAFVPCTGTKPEEMAANRRWAENAKKLHDAGVDPCRVLIDRTHAKGAEAWLSLRMTDMQYCFVPNHFRTPTYFARHPDLVSKAGGHGGGSVNYFFKDSRAWFAGVVAETAARYKDVDGIEIDIITGGETWGFALSGDTVNRPSSEMLNAFLAELKKIIVEKTGNPAAKMAVRLAYDTNFQFYRNVNSDLSMPGDILIPWVEGESTPGVDEWADRDRYGSRRIMPALPVSAVARGAVPRFAGRLSWLRGLGFPGVVIVGLEKAPAELRKQILVDGLADPDKAVRGSREIALPGNARLIEWKRVAWGYQGARTRYPWKLDKPWMYEFALQEGSVAEKSVVVEMSFDAVTVPKEIYLNGRKPTAVRKTTRSTAYVFPKDAVFGGVNQLYVPAQVQDDELELEDVQSVVPSVTGAVVKIDE